MNCIFEPTKFKKPKPFPVYIFNTHTHKQPHPYVHIYVYIYINYMYINQKQQICRCVVTTVTPSGWFQQAFSPKRHASLFFSLKNSDLKNRFLKTNPNGKSTVSPVTKLNHLPLSSLIALAGKDKFRSRRRARLCEEVCKVLRSALGNDFKAWKHRG